MADSDAQKKCFVIGPIGEPDSAERRNADWLLHHIIKPVLEAAPFRCIVKRADDISEPGIISAQVINAVTQYDLVVADLTGSNPNAFYELALRHMVEKPVIHVIEAGSKLPFDVSDYRTVFYSFKEWKLAEEAKNDLRKHSEAALAEDYEVSNPVTKARGLQKLAGSSDTTDQLLAAMVDRMDQFETRLANVDARVDFSKNISIADFYRPTDDVFKSAGPKTFPEFKKVIFSPSAFDNALQLKDVKTRKELDEKNKDGR